MTDYKEPPEPGVYSDVPMDEYHQWDAASNSQLSRLMKSPAHLKAYREDEFEETKAMRLGRMIHMAVLEPEQFAENYIVLGDCEAKTNSGKPCSYSASVAREDGQYCGTHDPLDGEEPADDAPEAVKESEFETALEIAKSVDERQAASSMLEGSGDIELTVVWDDPETGVRCKARYDRYSPDVPGGAIVDLKTARDAEPDQFRKQIFDHGYHRQAAMYLRGASALDYSIDNFVIIAAEKSSPYAVATYRLSDVVTDDVDDQLSQLLNLYQTCKENDLWPGYPDKVQDITIPSWAWDKVESQRNRIHHLKEGVATNGQ